MPLRSLFPALVALFLGTAIGAASPFDPCPVNAIGLPSGSFSVAAAAYDTTTTDGLNHVAYDLVSGTMLMHQCCTLTGAYFDVFDDYDVTGVPAGTPVTVTAALVVDGAVWTDGCGGTGCGGQYGAWLRHAAEGDSVFHSDHLFSGRTEHHDVLQIPVTIIAGTPERIRCTALGRRTPGGNHGSEAACGLTFAGLPPGAAIVSCQGYSGGPTPARSSSWGRVKVLYR